MLATFMGDISRSKPSDSKRASRVPRLSTYLALGAIGGIGFGLRAWRLDERSIWFDEAFTWRLATFRWAEMTYRSTLDNHPPLHFVVLKLWMALFGESVVALRILSVLCGTAACVAMYGVMVEAYGFAQTKADDIARGQRNARWLGLCTALFVAVSVMQIRWSCEVRSYALGAAFAAGSSWLLLRSLRLNSWRSWTAYALVASAFVYTHPYALFTLVAHAIFVLTMIARRTRRRRIAASTCATAESILSSESANARAITAGTLVFAAWLTWFPALLEQRAHVHRDISGWPVNYWSVPESCYQVWIEPQEPSRNSQDNLIATAVCAGILLALLFRATPGDWFLFLSATVPPALGIFVTVLDTPMYHSHFLLFAQLFLLAAVARLVGRIPSHPERSAVAAIVTANLLFIHACWWQRLDIANKPGVRAAVQAIEASRKPGEPLIVTSPFYFPSVLFYLHERSNCYLLDDGHSFRHYEGTAAYRPSDYIKPGQVAALSSGRVWAVNARAGTTWGQTELPAPGNWRPASRKEFPEVYGVQGSVEMVEYEVPSRERRRRKTTNAP